MTARSARATLSLSSHAHATSCKVLETIRECQHEVLSQAVTTTIIDQVLRYITHDVRLFIQNVKSMESNRSISPFQELLLQISVDDEWVSAYLGIVACIGSLRQITSENQSRCNIHRGVQGQCPARNIIIHSCTGTRIQTVARCIIRITNARGDFQVFARDIA